MVNYRNTGGRWPGFARSNHFAVRWTGRLRIFKTGHYYFSLYSDDGSKLWIDNRYTINNDGLHGWRNRQTRKHIRAGWRLVRLEMFERGGHAGMLFRYHGPDTGNRWAVVRASGKRGGYPITYRAGLFRENAFYFGQGGRCQNLIRRRPNMARWKHASVLHFEEHFQNTSCRKHSLIEYQTLPNVSASSKKCSVRWSTIAIQVANGLALYEAITSRCVGQLA